MSDMRLIVAGAGGRMGRALTRAISETSGAVLTGALEAPGSQLLGKDAGTLAGLPANGVLLSADLWSLSAKADGILDFTVPAATIANVAAPSGTALMLGDAAAEGRKITREGHSARGRDGQTGARRSGDIGFASLRGGTATGDHSVIFAGPMERIELTHRAEDRTMFAQGAIKAALWARNQKPGMYSMADVLGLSNS